MKMIKRSFFLIIAFASFIMLNVMAHPSDLETAEKNSLSSGKKHADKSSECFMEEKYPLPGKIIKIFVKEGDSVEKDTPLCVIECMKMHVIHKSQNAGVIRDIVGEVDHIVNEHDVFSKIYSILEPVVFAFTHLQTPKKEAENDENIVLTSSLSKSTDAEKSPPILFTESQNHKESEPKNPLYTDEITKTLCEEREYWEKDSFLFPINGRGRSFTQEAPVSESVSFQQEHLLENWVKRDKTLLGGGENFPSDPDGRNPGEELENTLMEEAESKEEERNLLWLQELPLFLEETLSQNGNLKTIATAFQKKSSLPSEIPSTLSSAISREKLKTLRDVFQNPSQASEQKDLEETIEETREPEVWLAHEASSISEKSADISSLENSFPMPSLGISEHMPSLAQDIQQDNTSENGYVTKPPRVLMDENEALEVSSKLAKNDLHFLKSYMLDEEKEKAPRLLLKRGIILGSFRHFSFLPLGFQGIYFEGFLDYFAFNPHFFQGALKDFIFLKGFLEKRALYPFQKDLFLNFGPSSTISKGVFFENSIESAAK